MCLLTNNEVACSRRDITVWKAVVVKDPGGNSVVTDGGNPGWLGLWRYNDKVFPFRETCMEEGGGIVRGKVGKGWFHSFASLCFCLKYIHRYFPHRVMDDSVMISRCTIPAGSRHHTGSSLSMGYLYASDRITVGETMSVMEAERLKERGMTCA